MRRDSSEDVVQRGEERYARELRERVEAEHRGEFLALDVDSGNYQIDSDMLAAVDRLKAATPDAVVYIVRIGYPSAVKLGGRSLVQRP